MRRAGYGVWEHGSAVPSCAGDVLVSLSQAPLSDHTVLSRSAPILTISIDELTSVFIAIVGALGHS